MQLTTLSGTIFCSANWSTIEIKVVGISKEECLEYFLKECTGIHLERSTYKVNRQKLEAERIEWTKAHPTIDSGSMWVNIDFEIFKENPDRYVNLYWDTTTFPVVTVK